MNRVVRTIPIGEHSTRHIVAIEDVPSTGSDIVARQFAFLSDLVNNGIYAGLLNCGPKPFETMRMRHDGSKWVIEMEAIEEKNV